MTSYITNNSIKTHQKTNHRKTNRKHYFQTKKTTFKKKQIKKKNKTRKSLYYHFQSLEIKPSQLPIPIKTSLFDLIIIAS